MNILNFRIRGKMAHFRRYYSNSSALSYSVPPRTTIIGLISGLLGYERDSYYEDFSPSKCRVAVGIRSSQKKKMQKLSLLMIKSAQDFNGSQPFHSQTPTELITPTRIRTDFLDYEIWFRHDNSNIMKTLNEQFHLKYGYLTKGVSAALGTAQHLGWVEGAKLLEGEETGQGESDIHSIIPIEKVLNIIPNDAYEFHLQKEDLPIHFHTDRTIAEKGDFLINTLASPVRAEVDGAIRLSDGRNITWMESN